MRKKKGKITLKYWAIVAATEGVARRWEKKNNFSSRGALPLRDGGDGGSGEGV
jgi:hypothetical protein